MRTIALSLLMLSAASSSAQIPEAQGKRVFSSAAEQVSDALAHRMASALSFERLKALQQGRQRKDFSVEACAQGFCSSWSQMDAVRVDCAPKSPGCTEGRVPYWGESTFTKEVMRLQRHAGVFLYFKELDLKDSEFVVVDTIKGPVLVYAPLVPKDAAKLEDLLRAGAVVEGKHVGPALDEAPSLKEKRNLQALPRS